MNQQNTFSYSYQNQQQQLSSRIQQPQPNYGNPSVQRPPNSNIPGNMINNNNNPPQRNRKPIHTAFFSNVPFNFPADKFQEFVMSFGEVSNMYSIIPTKGIAFVTYYDIRDAQKAVEQANDQILGGRPVRTNYANKSHFAHQDPKNTCSTLLVTSLANPSKLTSNEVIAKMREFGELSSANMVRSHPGQFVVKFYNLKHAHEAMNKCGPTTQIGNEPVTLEYKLEDEDNPDIPTTPKNPLQQQQQQQQQFKPNQQPPPPNYGMPGQNIQSTIPQPNYQNQYGAYTSQQPQPSPSYGIQQNYHSQPAPSSGTEDALKKLKETLFRNAGNI